MPAKKKKTVKKKPATKGKGKTAPKQSVRGVHAKGTGMKQSTKRQSHSVHEKAQPSKQAPRSRFRNDHLIIYLMIASFVVGFFGFYIYNPTLPSVEFTDIELRPDENTLLFVINNPQDTPATCVVAIEFSSTGEAVSSAQTIPLDVDAGGRKKVSLETNFPQEGFDYELKADCEWR